MASQTNLNDLLGGAGLDDGATNGLQLTIDDLGADIMAGLGDVSVDDIGASEALLVTLLLDNSGSIRFAHGNSDAVRTGHNSMLDALAASKQSAAVLVSCRYLEPEASTGNSTVLYPYRTLSGAVRLDNSNYNPNGGTPLYDQIAVTLASVAAKMAEFEDGGVAARAVTVIVTDGADMHSRTHRAHSVRPIVEGLLRTEAHIVACMGIDDGQTNFTRVFTEIGIPPEWILTPGSSPSEIRKAFAVVSQSAVRASQAAGATFSSVALGGFGQDS